MAELTLFSARACPFAHRTRLVLAEKRLDFELVEIDLQQKPAWFSTVSNYGKVPALQHKQHRIVESASRERIPGRGVPRAGVAARRSGGPRRGAHLDRLRQHGGLCRLGARCFARRARARVSRRATRSSSPWPTSSWACRRRRAKGRSGSASSPVSSTSRSTPGSSAGRHSSITAGRFRSRSSSACTTGARRSRRGPSVRDIENPYAVLRGTLRQIRGARRADRRRLSQRFWTH